MSDVLNPLLLGVALGSLYALFGVSFSLIYTPSGVFHLAHGAVFILAVYTIYGLTVNAGLPWYLGLLGALVLAAAYGVLIELAVYRVLRRRNASHLIVFIASTSVLVLTQGVLSIAFGTGHIGLPLQAKSLSDKLSLTNAQLASVVVTWTLIVPLAVVLKRSVWGTTIRAVGNSVEAARRRGINVPRVYLACFAIGSALLAPAAFLQTWSVGATPTVGLHVALIATAVTLIGGKRGVWSTAVVGVALGVVQALSLLVFPSGWQEGVTFLVLFLVVVVTGLAQARKLGHLR
ncbi:branched-chain amino acid ABC transporter permease [Micromonospora inositola]|uniref:Amino acid/amide ABC transporter membrane protein 1, HAAT family n=1 Tax=Micromonospora inositola TaxID=47865 RepID=A0A1C5K5H3_9ACTN|nr:branched-chain amino acid ABC transporter permease [Micromonospora inositola]SCG78030.1 amino acid/amide ABC transporter membrane protein 1, HAAT family [Micromonospora inositola]